MSTTQTKAIIASLSVPSASPSFEAVQNLTRDLKKAAVTLSKQEARFLVDSYYQMQDSRIRTAGQMREMAESGEPHEVLKWFNTQAEHLETEVQKALDAYSNGFVLGRWARSQYGIGPVIAAGLLAHIDIAKAETAGAIWRFAGLDPTSKWEKGQKRPWNAQLKVLCWKIGQSFLKQCNRDGDVYGHLLMERKALETTKNEMSAYSTQAAEILKRVPGHAQKAIYAAGKLPPGHILSRAERYAVKLFLAHYHHVGYELLHAKLPPKPYVIEHGGHTHFLAPPNWPIQEKIPVGLPGLP